MNTRLLSNADRAVVLEFLNRDPVGNVLAIGHILSNSLENRDNRGAFYGYYRDERLSGVALLGHLALIDGSTQAAMAFAHVARRHPELTIQKVLGEEPLVKSFDQALSKSQSATCAKKCDSQVLLSLEKVQGEFEPLRELRTAQTDDLDSVIETHAAAHIELLGTDPRLKDLDGFRQRVRRRIEQGHVLIARDHSGINFKLDLVFETEHVVYLEGVWLRPDLRGQGYGSAAIRTVCQQMLRRQKKICLFADAANHHTINFYHRIGFRAVSTFRLLHYSMSN